MRAPEVARHAVLRGQVPAVARRELAGDPSVDAVDRRLVDRAPHPDQVAELVDRTLHERKKRARRVGRGPSALADEPQRVREMVQRHHRQDSLLSQLTEDVAVVPDLARVELTFRGLDSRPLDRKPVRVLVELAQHREVLAIAVVVVARDRGRVAIGDMARRLLPLPPVVVAVVALDLVRRARRSPKKALGEGLHRYAAALAGLSIRGGGTYSQDFGVSPSISSRSMPALPKPLRCISRSFCGRPSSRIHAAFSGSAWLTRAIASPGRSAARRRTTSSTRFPITAIVCRLATGRVWPCARTTAAGASGSASRSRPAGSARTRPRRASDPARAAAEA